VGYAFGLPRAADFAARRLPLSVEASIGQRAAEFFDRGVLQPSTLAPERQAHLESLFASIVPQGDPRHYRLEFRAGGRIGANAFALPGGTVVMTDELVRLAGGDDALLGVMAHEIGHVEQRHILRRMISGTVTAAAATLLVGDASGLVAAVPATLADMSYSRDMEREADTYAVGLLSANGVALEPFAHLLEKLQGERGNGGAARRPDADAYLSSHPDTAERVRAIRAAESGGEAEVDDDSH
jgi:predicted Zn-dependent protease